MPSNSLSDSTNENISRNAESSEGDLVSARESIRSERVMPVDAEQPQRKKRLDTWITSFIAVGGLLFTVYTFDKTMKAQRHSTAETAVGQFIAQVTELRTQENLMLANAKHDGSVYVPPSPSPLDRLIVSRAQMLIDGDETGKFAGDILRFLAANEYGSYIGRSPMDKDVPKLSVGGLVLVNSKLAHTTAENIILKCIGFEQGLFDSVNFPNGKFDYVFLKDSRLQGVDFSGAWLSGINFFNTEFSGRVIFDNAKLYGVDFSDSRFGDYVSFNGAQIIKSNMSNIEHRSATDTTEEDRNIFPKTLALALSKANSLYGTEIGEEVEKELRTIMGEKEFNKLTSPLDGKYIVDPELISWSWDQKCPPQQRRDKRLNSAPSVSFDMVKALF